MKRRNFIKHLARTAAVSPFVINGLPMKAIGSSSMFKRLTNGPFENRKIVLIQLHGGNDGLNTLIPMEQYATYQSYRTNIAIPDTGNRAYVPLDNTLAIPDQVGVHPDMMPIKTMYDAGKVSVVQAVGYENVNQSHFRSRDIWFMGGSFDEYKRSGWMGRYLDHIYPDYPDAYPTTDMPDPLGLEIGTKVSLGYHREVGIPVALATDDPGNFSDLISGLGGPNPQNIPSNFYGNELQYIIDLYDNANVYAAQLQNRYNTGQNYVPYPINNVMTYPGPAPVNVLENPLGWQLQTVARLIHGGCKTRIYLVRIGGFDTHDGQVIQNDTTHGMHGALLYHLSTAVKAFFDDLAASGYDEEVIAMTFSDFGRRPFDNASFGTDHGTAAPAFIFGKGVEAGVVGTNPDLDNLDSTNNLIVQHDYRQILTTLLCDWMGADNDALIAAEFEDWADDKLPLISPEYSDPITSTEPVIASTTTFSASVYPNPTQDIIKYNLHSSVAKQASISIYTVLGQEMLHKKVSLVAGENEFSEDISHYPAGQYILTIRDEDFKVMASKKITKK